MAKPASPKGEEKPPAPRPRDKILAQALRANLKRRKVAAKARLAKA